MVPVLEAVPNFSAGRDPAFLDELTRTVSEAGAEVWDVSADADHHRSVLTFVGTPSEVEEAAVRAAEVAVRSIDIRRHEGVHPRVGALDVLPFVPLTGLTLDDARASARRVGERLAREVGVPVFLYGEASEPRGRTLAELRRDGLDGLGRRVAEGLRPDFPAAGEDPPALHPTAGATCVGARPLLLAWNVDVAGVSEDALRAVAAELREVGDGLPGLRALGLVLPVQGRMQISMNLEDVRNRAPFQVFRAVEDRIRERGGEVTATEVIGMIPEELLLGAGADRLSLLDPGPGRVLSSRLADHVAARTQREVEALLEVVRDLGDEVPSRVREAAESVGDSLIGPLVRDEKL